MGAMTPSLAAAAAVDGVPRGPTPSSVGGQLIDRKLCPLPAPPDDVLPSDTDVEMPAAPHHLPSRQ